MIPGPFSVQQEDPVCLICLWSPAGETKTFRAKQPQWEGWSSQPEQWRSACGAVNNAGWSWHGSRRHSGHCYAYSEIALGSFVLSRIWCEPTQMALTCFHWCKWGIQVWNEAVASWSAWELRQKALDKGNSFGQKVMRASLMSPRKACADLWNRSLKYLLYAELFIKHFKWK